MTQFPAALPTKLTQQLAGNREGLPVKVFAQDETRLGLQPIIRRRITAYGVQPVATVWQRFDNFYLFGAVEPTTGDGFFLELPLLNSAMFQLWLDDFAQTFAASFNILVLDNGAFHTAKALRWPPNVATVPFPPYSPELNPMERLWRDLKDQLAHSVAKTLDALSDTVCGVIQRYSQAALQSLTGFAYFVQAVQTALHSPNV
jgi:DDE superfamily endonuclease